LFCHTQQHTRDKQRGGGQDDPERAMAWLFLLLTAATCALDQGAKQLILARRPAGGWRLAGGRVRLGCVLTVGGPGLRGPAPRCLGVWLGLALSTALAARYAPPFQTAAAAAGLAIALGGATGNAMDRLRRGAVVDFIAVGRWPVFNLADAAIVLGAASACIFRA
jgi:signal peptidase II